jgi:hypothetical protein
MFWYVIPIYKMNLNGYTSYLPGFGSEIILAADVERYICHAHNPKYDPSFCLIGLQQGLPTLPEGWSQKTLDEAREYFSSVCNRAPLDTEIF